MFSGIEEKGYTDTLFCPEGYKLNRIVATTYSLEPHLIYLLACMFDYDSNEYINADLSIAKTLASFVFEANVKTIIEQKRLLVFYQQDKFSCKLNLSQDKKFTALIRECCRPVKKEKYAFHPKIILAEYINNNNQIIHRLVVSSRNLTMSDLFETQVVLEKEAEKKLEINNLIELIKYVNKSEWSLLGKSEEIEVQVVFQSPEEENQKLKTKILIDNSEIIVLSPFFSGVKNRKLQNLGNAKYYMGDKLHSKIFCVTTDDKSSLWVGSANCTVNGLNNNYECMVALKFNRNIQAEFENWLQGKGFTSVDAPTEVEASNDKSIEKIVREGEFTWKAESDQSGNYTVTVSVECSDSDGDSFNKLKMGLLGVGCNKEFSKEVKFERIEKHQLTNALLIKDTENNSRIIFATVSDDESMNLLSEVTSDLSKERIDNLIPDFVIGGRNNCDDNDDDFNEDSRYNDCRNQMTFSPSDEECEKIIKLYGYNRTDLLKKIYSKLEENRELYDSNKYKAVVQMLNALIGEESEGF